MTFLSGRRIKFQSPHKVGKCLYHEYFSTFLVKFLFSHCRLWTELTLSLQKNQCLVTTLGLCLHCFLGNECTPPKNQPILGANYREQKMQFGAVLRQPNLSFLHSLQIPDSSIIVKNEKTKWGTTNPCHSLQCAEHLLCTGNWVRCRACEIVWKHHLKLFFQLCL